MTLGELTAKLSIKTLLAGAVVASVVAAGIVTYNYDSEQKSAPVAVSAVDEAKKMDELLAALLRSFTITEACYDYKSRNYLVKVADHSPIEGKLDEGWYFMQKYHFDELSNGTWVLSSFGNFVSISPDVTGLKCKQQANNPSWFR